MLVCQWAPISPVFKIPPLGEELAEHINSYRGAVFFASCSAWNLLYKVLAENDCPIGKIAFTEKGKPFFIDSNIYFSLSHSKDVCGVAISDNHIGIDIERYRDDYKAKLIEKTLTEKEKASFDGNYTKLWCRKEAIAKMTGEGLEGYPNNIDTLSYRYNERIIEYLGNQYWFTVVRMNR